MSIFFAYMMRCISVGLIFALEFSVQGQDGAEQSAWSIDRLAKNKRKSLYHSIWLTSCAVHVY